MRWRRWVYVIPLRLRSLFRRGQLDRELDEEMRFHLDRRIEQEIAAGAAPEEARNAALRAMEGFELRKEECRDARSVAFADTMTQDLRYALRTLRHSPALSLVAILSLALGIGANTAIFSLLNAVVLRLLPVTDPHRIVQLTYTFPADGPNNWNSWFGYPQYERFRTQSGTLSGIFGGHRLGRVNVVDQGIAGLAQADAYTDSFFTVLGVAPQIGRLFAAGDDRPDAAVIVLSDHYWRGRFGADRSIAGRAVTINQIPFTVIGVTPPEFSGISVGSGPDLWVPLRALDRLKPDRNRWTESFSSWMLIGGRLRQGISLSQSQAELDVLHWRLLAEQLSVSELRNRENMKRFVRESHLMLRPAANGMYSGLRERYALPLKLLMGVSGIVLLVACANVANLLLARAARRRREIAVRLALGAGRRRVVRQLLTESLLLASIGGVAAIALAWWGSAALVRMISTGDAPAPLDVRPDWLIFGFAAAVSMLTGLLFGLAPAVRGTRVDLAPDLKEGVRQAGGRSSFVLERGLIVAQVGLSVVLVIGCRLFARTLHKLWALNLGYERENVLMFSVDARLAGHPIERAGAIYRDMLERLQRLPVVRSVSASVVRPVDDAFYLVDVVDSVDGRRLPDREMINVAWNSLSPGYFRTVGTPILHGRDFDLRDDETAPPVVIINESLAARAFPGANAIGRRLGLATVIGVVKNSHYNGVFDKPRPVLYRPLFQHGRNQEYRWGFVSFELRHHAGADLVGDVRREIAAVDLNLPIFRVRTLRAQTEQSLLRERLLGLLSSFFAGLALLLVCLGLYGLMSYAVARRTSEIGIRMALGARRGNILWLVWRESLLLTLAGVAIGVPLALWASRYAKTLLYEVDPADPLTLAVTIATLLTVAAIAGYLPVRRALRLDAMVALRHE